MSCNVNNVVMQGWLAVKARGGGEVFRFCQDNFLSKKSLEVLGL